MKKTLSVFICTIILSAIWAVPPVSAYTPPEEILAEAAVLVNLDTDTIMFSRETDKILPPASLTKIMTTVIALESGEDLDSTVISVPKYCLDILLGTDSSMSGIKADEEMTLRQHLYAMLMMSGNDVANVLADHFGGGDIDNFVKKMNDKAKALGMKNTAYANPHGLPDPIHMTTVSDMLKLVRHAMTLPGFMDIVSTVRYDMPATNKSAARRLATSNLMMDSTSVYYNRYVKGIKTGYTDEAGRCLISTASKDGYNYLAIVMKSPPKDAAGKSIMSHFSDTKKLYTWAFDTFEYKEILTGIEPIAELPVALSWDTDYVQLVPEKPLTTLIPKTANASTVLYKTKLVSEKANAPVKKSGVYGTVDIIYAGETIGTVNLVAADSVERSTILFIYQKFLQITGHTLFKIAAVLLGVLLIILIILNIIRNKRKRRRRVRSYRRV